jgi:hypothetical protein
MINIALNKRYNNKLKTLWIDVKKAFDSIDHNYLLECIDSLNFPRWAKIFIRAVISRWKLNIICNKELTLTKVIKKVILQCDSLSPLLFIIIMDPLSKRLNGMFPKVQIQLSEQKIYCTNHLLFIDDLKILSEKDSTLEIIALETKLFFNKIGLEMNMEKSATNSMILISEAVLLTNINCYKYLGILED